MTPDLPVPPARRRLLVAFLVALGLTVLLGPAAATHRVDQRFTVWGQVTNADGAPVVDQGVDIIVADGFRVQRVRTNADGWYRKVLAVTEADLGKVFDVRMGRQRVHVKVEFNPHDRDSERGKRVDFVIGDGE